MDIAGCSVTMWMTSNLVSLRLVLALYIISHGEQQTSIIRTNISRTQPSLAGLPTEDLTCGIRHHEQAPKNRRQGIRPPTLPSGQRPGRSSTPHRSDSSRYRWIQAFSRQV